MKPTRTQPAIGTQARVWSFGGESEAVVIVELREQGRVLIVAGEDGRRREFTLRRASAAFIERDERHSPRLDF